VPVISITGLFQTIVYRTDLITDPQVAAAVDVQVAARACRWPSMTQGRLAAVIDKIVAGVDADAVRRPKDRGKGREVSIWGFRTAPPSWRGGWPARMPVRWIGGWTRWSNRALDAVYAQAGSGPDKITMTSAQWRTTRWALRSRENKLSDDKRRLVNQIARANPHIGRAWTLKEQARDRYRIDHPPGVARRLLKAWITAAKRSRIAAFVKLGKRFQVYFQPILAAIELKLSNVLIESINAKIRLINARGYGHHSAQTLTSMIYLTLGGLHPQLPTRR
jgi:hypothetical protein